MLIKVCYFLNTIPGFTSVLLFLYMYVKAVEIGFAVNTVSVVEAGIVQLTVGVQSGEVVEPVEIALSTLCATAIGIVAIILLKEIFMIMK